MTLRFLSYNTYLLAAREIRTPLGPVNIAAKPARAERATELGQTLGAYDVCCLSEVFTSDSRDRIVAGLDGAVWKTNMGSDDSGLFFLAKGRPIAPPETMIFSNRGERLRDSDAWSKKGILFNVIDVGLGKLEVFQSHLFYGGGLPGIDEPSEDDRMLVRRAELAELADFYRRHHRPKNIAVVTGDFNINGADPRQYAAVRETMDSLNLHDLWSWDVYEQDPNQGYTCRFTDGPEEGWWRNFLPICAPIGIGAGLAEDYCHDYLTYGKQPRGVGRYDYIFVERPTNAHLEVSRILRRPFQRNRVTHKEQYLSDHLGLDVTIYLSPR